jgi:menaquinone-dependent protoporphyrinogen oxidase
MKTLILYATKHGTTKACAKELQKLLTDDSKVLPIEAQETDLSTYDRIVLGSSVYMGDINRKMKSFIKKNKDILEGKISGLFLCCMYKDQQAKVQFQKGYPEALRKKAIAHGFFGGAFDFDRMNFMEKKIIKKVAQVEQSVNLIDKDALKQFANILNK